MLVLSRRIEEAIVLDGGRIRVSILGVQGGRVRLGIEAPLEVDVQRELRSTPLSGDRFGEHAACLK